MLSGLFDTFQNLLSTYPSVIVLLSFVWGVLSILLSPCHLSGVPLAIMGLQKKSAKPEQMVWKFALGLLLSFVVFLVITLLFRGAMLLVAPPNDLIMFLVLFASGVMLLDLFELDFSFSQNINWRPGLLAIGTGLIFGLLIGPCTLAFAMPVISISGVMKESFTLTSIMVLLSFSVGHMIAAVGIGSSISRVSKWLSQKKTISTGKTFVAIILIGTSLYFLFKYGQSF